MALWKHRNWRLNFNAQKADQQCRYREAVTGPSDLRSASGLLRACGGRELPSIMIRNWINFHDSRRVGTKPLWSRRRKSRPLHQASRSLWF